MANLTELHNLVMDVQKMNKLLATQSITNDKIVELMIPNIKAKAEIAGYTITLNEYDRLVYLKKMIGEKEVVVNMLPKEQLNYRYKESI